ncbi:polymeric immunoglobulin receptor-like [Silurus meridionalis]|nr:polymeric immunoglobulin receptor-like [Silurus meridionalis]
MKILIIIIFTFCLISDGQEVTGYSGGAVLIKCKYDPEYKLKYFCKNSWPGCSNLETEAKNEWVTPGRFTLFDDTKSAEIRVMIRELTVEDAGTYQCGFGNVNGKDIFTRVELKVQEGSSGSREVNAYTGGEVNIKSRYEDEYKDKPKSICRIGTQQWCFTQTTKNLYTEWTHGGRFSVYNNRSAGFFNVFIRELIMEDTGTYLFTVAVSDEIKTYTVVNLIITEDLSYEKSISKTVQVGEDLNINCKYPESLRNYSKFLCKRHAAAVCPYKMSVKARSTIIIIIIIITTISIIIITTTIIIIVTVNTITIISTIIIIIITTISIIIITTTIIIIVIITITIIITINII